MKIVHICLSGPFSEGYSYQENLLTKYHVRIGYEVFVITSTWALNNTGVMEEVERENYRNKDQVSIFRVNMKGRNDYSKKLKRFNDYSKILNKIKPDIIFVHGSQFLDVNPIIQYKLNNKDTKIYVDNHADFSNSATNILSKELLHKKIWKRIAQKIEPYVDEFYGVLPARVNFLIDVYKVPKNKVSLLNMGGDDDFVRKFAHYPVVNFKNRIGCDKSQTLIVTGGKIDGAKKEVLLLMEYVRQRPDLFLLIFGSIEEQIQPSFESLLSENIKHIGWVDTEESYKIFAMSDLVVFPGRHSVYWEQTVSQKKPMVVKHWDGTDHIDIGGNVAYVNYSYNEKEKLFNKLSEVLYSSKLDQMKYAARSNKSTSFLYSDIAKRSIKGI